MKPTVEEFKQFVEEQGDLEIKWYGEYQGRCYHKGVAVSGCLGDGGALVERMNNNGQSLGRWGHQDNMGFDAVMSWDVSCFRSDEEDECGREGSMMKITCDRELGDEEMEMLVAEAKMMDVLAMNKTWVGDGMLYRTTAKDKFHFVDQKYVEEV